MSPKFEEVIKQIVAKKTGWNALEIIILGCTPAELHFDVLAMVATFDRSKTPDSFSIRLTEVIMYLN